MNNYYSELMRGIHMVLISNDFFVTQTIFYILFCFNASLIKDYLNLSMVKSFFQKVFERNFLTFRLENKCQNSNHARNLRGVGGSDTLFKKIK